MDLQDRKKGWKEKQIIEYEQCLDRKNCYTHVIQQFLLKIPTQENMNLGELETTNMKIPPLSFETVHQNGIR